MYDSSTLPKVKVKEDSRNNVDIQKIQYDKDVFLYTLYLNGRQENTMLTAGNKVAKEQYSSYDLAYGNVLISGLGFGLLALWLAKKPEVKTIKVIEISQDVVDMFLENNSLPDNVIIEVADMEKYKSNEKYDCILLDHYEGNGNNWKIRSIQKVANNIPNHDVLWFWSIEDVYVQKCYEGLIADRINKPFYEEQKDFSEKWNFFIQEILQVKTIPLLDKDKVNEYIYTYIDFLNSKYVYLKNKDSDI